MNKEQNNNKKRIYYVISDSKTILNTTNKIKITSEYEISNYVNQDDIIIFANNDVQTIFAQTYAKYLRKVNIEKFRFGLIPNAYLMIFKHNDGKHSMYVSIQ